MVSGSSASILSLINQKYTFFSLLFVHLMHALRSILLPPSLSRFFFAFFGSFEFIYSFVGMDKNNVELERSTFGAREY